MVRGLYTSALGMMTQMQRMDVVSNNIANADTTGYKKDQVAAQSFTETLMRRINDPGMRLFKDFPIGTLSHGVFIDDIYTDFSSGALKQTNGDLDAAIMGQGFFTVTVDGRTLYTRDGSFSRLADGTLVTMDGGKVQGEDGDIVLPDGFIDIDEQGRVMVNNEYIDTLKLVDFADKHTLRKQQDNYYSATSQQPGAFTGQVAQGYLESSNANAVKEMVEMIALSRAYETNSRMITVHDQTMGRAVNDIARR